MTYIKPLDTRIALVAVAMLCALLAGNAGAQTQAQPKLPSVSLSNGLHVIKAELAITPEQQATGMMFRREMGANEGMLFVAESPAVRCFWMRNTFIPLSIAFIADDGTIVNIADMKPLDESSRNCSAAPVRFALEVNQGWFAKRGIQAGTKLRGRPFGN